MARITCQLPVAQIPTAVKNFAYPDSTEVADMGILGYKTGEKFYCPSVLAERLWLANTDQTKRLSDWKPDVANGKRKIVVVHDECFSNVRFTTEDRYFGDKSKVNIIREDLFDRAFYEVYQYQSGVDFYNPLDIGKLAKNLAAQDIGRKFVTFVVNRFHNVMSVNDTQPDGEKLGKDFFINVMGDFLQLLRYHTRNPVVFLGFGARMGDHAINDGRILALDALRQKNPFLMKDDIYVADITSCSKEVATGPAWPQWELSRLQLLRNLAMAIHQE
jgi:hypothetical protein